jgi:hypothetical protein
MIKTLSSAGCFGGKREESGDANVSKIRALYALYKPLTCSTAPLGDRI